jgi:asparagine synthase (glutamine-hydrolysing)
VSASVHFLTFACRRQFDVVRSPESAKQFRGRFGEKWRHAIRYRLATAQQSLYHGALADGLELAYPYLYRPLVEFCLRLPAIRLIGASQQKLVLRDAMRGLLPELVRTRPDKGGFGARFRWALTREGPLIDKMTRQPLVAEYGWVDASVLRKEVDLVRGGRSRNVGELLNVLALETWLRVRDGNWHV